MSYQHEIYLDSDIYSSTDRQQVRVSHLQGVHTLPRLPQIHFAIWCIHSVPACRAINGGLITGADYRVYRSDNVPIEFDTYGGDAPLFGNHEVSVFVSPRIVTVLSDSGVEERSYSPMT